MERHPAERDVLDHSNSLLKPTHKLMSTEFVFRSHRRELLERLIIDADTRPGTAAEACCICCYISLRTPLNSPACGLTCMDEVFGTPTSCNSSGSATSVRRTLRGIYSHVTAVMVEVMPAALQRRWNEFSTWSWDGTNGEQAA